MTHPVRNKIQCRLYKKKEMATIPSVKTNVKKKKKKNPRESGENSMRPDIHKGKKIALRIFT